MSSSGQSSSRRDPSSWLPLLHQPTAIRPNHSSEIQALINLPVLDGDAAMFASRSASSRGFDSSASSAGGLPISRFIRRRRADINLRAAASSAPLAGPTTSTTPLNASALASRFGNINLRLGATPPRNNTATPGPATGLEPMRAPRGPPPAGTAAAPMRAPRGPPEPAAPIRGPRGPPPAAEGGASPMRAPRGPPPAAAAAAASAAAAVAAAPLPRIGVPIRDNRTFSAIQRAGRAQQIARTKQFMTDRFYHFNDGAQHWRSWDRERRRPFWQRIPIPPRQGEWPGHPLLQSGEDLRALSQYRSNERRLGKDVNDGREGGNGGVKGIFNRVKRDMTRGRVELVRRLCGGSRPRAQPARASQQWFDANQRMLNGLNAQVQAGFEPAGIKFKRSLGQGGFGAVFLYEMVGRKGAKYPIVVKASTHQEEDREGPGPFDGEIKNLTAMNGAAHFVQRVYLQDLPLPAPRRGRQIRLAAREGLKTIKQLIKQPGQRRLPPLVPDADRVPGYTSEELYALRAWRWQLDNSTDFVLLENMSHGDVTDLIRKLVSKQQRLSNRALWAILECLFKGCIGMAMPGQFHEEGMDANAHAMAETDETAPAWFYDGMLAPTRPMVHFDLDPQNALVGNFGEAGGSHENVPVIKIADPGLAIIVDDQVLNDELGLWQLRGQGKAEYLTPEQFTPEWEYTAAIDLPNLSIQPTAGNYNWWSNLYQIGWIMWSLVTQCYPPSPPQPFPYTYRNEQQYVGGDVGGFTYGMHVMSREFDWCDMELRRQILRLLDHDATRRPAMGWLEAVCEFNCARPDLVEAESDEQLRAHMQDIYGNP